MEIIMDPNIFRGYYDTLDEALEVFPLEVQTTLEFVRRGDKHSAVIYIRNDGEETMKSIDDFLGKYGFTVPRNLYSPGPEGTRTGLIAIDLGTLDTDSLRIYVTTTHNKPKDPKDYGEKWHWGTGYYLNKTGDVLGKKHYNIELSSKTVYVDYFDAEDNIISSSSDSEHVTDDWKVWGGPEDLYNAVKENNLDYVIAHKTKKDQGYFMVSLPKKIINNKKNT